MEKKERPWAIDEAVSNAGILASVLSVATERINDMDFSGPNGGRNRALDQLHGLLFAAESLSRQLVDEIDRLPRPKGDA